MFTEKTMESVSGELVGLTVDVEAFERAFELVPGVEWVKVLPQEGGEVTVVYRMQKRVTTISRIIAAANAGAAPREIATLVGWRPESVSSVLSRARAEGKVIRRHPAGRPPRKRWPEVMATDARQAELQPAEAAETKSGVETMRSMINAWRLEFDAEIHEARQN